MCPIAGRTRLARTQRTPAACLGDHGEGRGRSGSSHASNNSDTVRRAWSASAAKRAAMAAAFAVAVPWCGPAPEVTLRSPPTRDTIW